MIDTHVHFWEFDPVRDGWISEDMEVLQRDYLPQDLQRIIGRFDVEGVVAVQADQSAAETTFLCSLAQQHAFIKGVVGWVDLTAGDLSNRLQEYAQQKVIKGFRHLLQGEEPGFMLNEAFVEGVRALKLFDFTYDILVTEAQLPEVIKFLELLPDQRLIIDHCPKPAIGSPHLQEWKLNMQKVADKPNVCCKVSGLVTEAPWRQWTAEDLFPYLDVVFESFGPDRVLFGSDWPVIYTSADYGKWVGVMQEYMTRFNADESEKFFTGNAIKFYNL